MRCDQTRSCWLKNNASWWIRWQALLVTRLMRREKRLDVCRRPTASKEQSSDSAVKMSTKPPRSNREKYRNANLQYNTGYGAWLCRCLLESPFVFVMNSIRLYSVVFCVCLLPVFSVFLSTPPSTLDPPPILLPYFYSVLYLRPVLLLVLLLCCNHPHLLYSACWPCPCGQDVAGPIVDCVLPVSPLLSLFAALTLAILAASPCPVYLYSVPPLCLVLCLYLPLPASASLCYCLSYILVPRVKPPRLVSFPCLLVFLFDSLFKYLNI